MPVLLLIEVYWYYSYPVIEDLYLQAMRRPCEQWHCCCCWSSCVWLRASASQHTWDEVFHRSGDSARWRCCRRRVPPTSHETFVEYPRSQPLATHSHRQCRDQRQQLNTASTTREQYAYMQQSMVGSLVSGIRGRLLVWVLKSTKKLISFILLTFIPFVTFVSWQWLAGPARCY